MNGMYMELVWKGRGGRKENISYFYEIHQFHYIEEFVFYFHHPSPNLAPFIDSIPFIFLFNLASDEWISEHKWLHVMDVEIRLRAHFGPSTIYWVKQGGGFILSWEVVGLVFSAAFIPIWDDRMGYAKISGFPHHFII
jgi:hypothetical protein